MIFDNYREVSIRTAVFTLLCRSYKNNSKVCLRNQDLFLSFLVQRWLFRGKSHPTKKSHSRSFKSHETFAKSLGYQSQKIPGNSKNPKNSGAMGFFRICLQDFLGEKSPKSPGYGNWDPKKLSNQNHLGYGLIVTAVVKY